MPVYSYKLRSYDPVVGALLKKGTARVLVQRLPMDYAVDGYQLLLANKLTATSTEWEEQKALVLQLKGSSGLAIPPYPVDSDYELFCLLHKRQELIGIYIRNDTFLAGRVHQVNPASFHLHLLSTKGVWLGIHSFRFERIKIIEAGTDYLHSIGLLAAHIEGLNAA